MTNWQERADDTRASLADRVASEVQRNKNIKLFDTLEAFRRVEFLGNDILHDIEEINNQTDFWQGLGVVTYEPRIISDYGFNFFVTLAGYLPYVRLKSESKFEHRFGFYEEWHSYPGPDFSTSQSVTKKFGAYEELVGNRILGYETTSEIDPYTSVRVGYVLKEHRYSVEVNDGDRITADTRPNREGVINHRHKREKSYDKFEHVETLIKEFLHNQVFIEMINARKGIVSLGERLRINAQRNPVLIAKIESKLGKIVKDEDLDELRYDVQY